MKIERKEIFHRMFCKKIVLTVMSVGDMLNLKSLRPIKFYNWLGCPYSHQLGSLYACKICGIEIYEETREGEKAVVMWHNWQKQPDFDYWSNKFNRGKYGGTKCK